MAAKALPPHARTHVDLLVRQLKERPLFVPGRRPAREVPDGASDLPRLSGLIVDGARRIAIFAGADGSAARVAEPGQAVGGYGVVAIADGTVTVDGPGGARTVGLAFDKSAPKPEAPLPLGPPELLRLDASRAR